MPPELHLDPARLDLEQIVADQEAIRRVNPQRFEMEHLTAIVLCDFERQLIAGYKDVRADEFWVRGHMPDCSALVVESFRVTRDDLQVAGQLKVVQKFGTGLRNIDIAACVEKFDRISTSLRAHRTASAGSSRASA